MERVSASMVDDTDPLAAGTPDPISIGENLLLYLHYLLQVVARFTMPPMHYVEYAEIVGHLHARITPYAEFRSRMVAFLQQSSNYAHMRVYWDVFDRVILGEEQTQQDDNPLFLYPVALYALVNLFLYASQIRDPLWNVEQSEHTLLASQRESSRIRNRRYRMGGGDPIRALEPFINPEWNLAVWLDYFQDWGASIMMRREDYVRYVRLMFDQNHGFMTRDRFTEEMGALLQSRPQHQSLRLWWHIHRMDVCGVRRITYSPFLCRPLALCITWNIVFYFALYGDTLWDHFLTMVRRYRP